MTATKHDTGKRDWSILPWGQAEQIVKVLELGAQKYGRFNWQRPGNGFRLRVQNALLRHVIAYANGERKDEESGLHPLAHAACNCLFLMYYDGAGRRSDET